MTKPLPRGWKILNAHRRSSSNYTARSVLYVRNRRAVPEYGNGPLAVFATKQLAVHFSKALYMKGFMIVPCKYSPSTHRHMWYRSTGDIEYVMPLFAAPTGTILADSVTCLG